MHNAIPAPLRPSFATSNGESTAMLAAPTRPALSTILLWPSPTRLDVAIEPNPLHSTPIAISIGKGPSCPTVSGDTPLAWAISGTQATAPAAGTPTNTASQVPSRTTRTSPGGSSAFAATNGITPRTAPVTAAIAGK